MLIPAIVLVGVCTFVGAITIIMWILSLVAGAW